MKRFLVLFLLVLLTCCGIVYLYLKSTNGSLSDFDPIILYPFCLAASFVLATILNSILSPRLRRMTAEELYASRPDETKTLRSDILETEGLEPRVVEASGIEHATPQRETLESEGAVSHADSQTTSGSAGVAALGASAAGAAGLAALASDSDEQTVEDAAITPEHITEKVALLSEQQDGIADDGKSGASTTLGYGDAGRRAKARFSARRRNRHYAVAANRALPKGEAPKTAPVPRREIVRRTLDLENRAKIAGARARARIGTRKVKVEPFRVEKKSKFFDT